MCLYTYKTFCRKALYEMTVCFQRDQSCCWQSPGPRHKTYPHPVQHCTTLHTRVKHCTTLHTTTQYCTTLHNTVQHSKTLYNTLPQYYSTTNTARHCKTLHNTAQPYTTPPYAAQLQSCYLCPRARPIGRH